MKQHKLGKRQQRERLNRLQSEVRVKAQIIDLFCVPFVFDMNYTSDTKTTYKEMNMEMVIMILSVALVMAMVCVVMEMVVVVHKCRYVRHVYAEREYWRTQAEDKDELLDRIEILNANLDRLRPKYDTDECKCHNNANGDK